MGSGRDIARGNDTAHAPALDSVANFHRNRVITPTVANKYSMGPCRTSHQFPPIITKIR